MSPLPVRARRILSPLAETHSLGDLALLVLRVTVGFEMFGHGLQKLGHFGGTFDAAGNRVSGSAAIHAQADFLKLLGYHPSVALSWFLTFTELSAGILLMTGFLTPLAAAAVVGDMFEIVFGFLWKAGWFGNGQANGFEYAAIILAAGAALSLAGPGRYSADGVLGWRLRGFPAGLAGVALGLAVGLFVLLALGPGFGGSSLPTVAASASAPATQGETAPTRLVGQWTRTVTGADVKRARGTGIPAGSACALTVETRGATHLVCVGAGGFEGKIVSAGTDRVHISLGDPAPNIYSWRVAERLLTFTKISDPVLDRVAVMSGVWKRK
jgi:putative oxidoreductase